jgi:hypothetical protein
VILRRYLSDLFAKGQLRLRGKLLLLLFAHLFELTRFIAGSATADMVLALLTSACADASRVIVNQSLKAKMFLCFRVVMNGLPANCS